MATKLPLIGVSTQRIWANMRLYTPNFPALIFQGVFSSLAIIFGFAPGIQHFFEGASRAVTNRIAAVNEGHRKYIEALKIDENKNAGVNATRDRKSAADKAETTSFVTRESVETHRSNLDTSRHTTVAKARKKHSSNESKEEIKEGKKLAKEESGFIREQHHTQHLTESRQLLNTHLLKMSDLLVDYSAACNEATGSASKYQTAAGQATTATDQLNQAMKGVAEAKADFTKALNHYDTSRSNEVERASYIEEVRNAYSTMLKKEWVLNTQQLQGTFKTLSSERQKEITGKKEAVDAQLKEILNEVTPKIPGLREVFDVEKTRFDNSDKSSLISKDPMSDVVSHLAKP